LKILESHYVVNNLVRKLLGFGLVYYGNRG
jgi:hypothetical protein